MAKIDEQVIEQLRHQVNIVDVIRHYIPLTKKGKNYWAVCPFHGDSNPSLSVSEEKQIYKCFSCGAGGNVFTFVQNYNNVGFLDALQIVSDIGHVQIPEISQLQSVGQISSKYQKLYDINQKISDFYSYYLKTQSGSQAFNYLKDRHIDREIIDYFKIGYAPSSKQMNGYFQKLTQEKELIDVDAIYFKDDGTMFPRFFNRIIFPIEDENNHIIGFSGRTMTNEVHIAKYVNTSEIAIFKKNQVLYNLNRAMLTARKEQSIYLVEGYMDVIAFYKAGVKNVVATMGTALTKEHIQKLKRYVKEIIVCYDGDRAGCEATLKAMTAIEQAGIKTQAIIFEQKLDPDEYLIRFGQDAFLNNLLKRQSKIQYAITFFSSDLNLTNHQDVKTFIYQVIKMINESNEQDPIVIEMYIQELVKKTKFNDETIRSLLKKSKTKQEKKEISIQLPIHYEESKGDGYLRAEQQLLSMMLQYPRVAKLFEKELGYMYQRQHNILANTILDYYRVHQNMDISLLISRMSDQGLINDLMEIAFIQSDFDYNEAMIKELIQTIKNYGIVLRIEELQNELEQTSDRSQKLEIGLQLLAEENKLKK